MIIVMGTARLGPGELDRLGDAMRAQIEATRAEAGCVHYSFARDVLDPDLLHVAERWRDQAAIDVHFKTPHMAAFQAALGAATVLSLSVKAYDADGERTLMGE
jgi:quinol monooxygenase YgiN